MGQDGNVGAKGVGFTPRKLSGTGSVKERERDFAEPGSAGPPPPPRGQGLENLIKIYSEDFGLPAPKGFYKEHYKRFHRWPQILFYFKE